MANMSAFDASKLAERLQGLGKEEFWLHLEAASMLEKYPAKQHARRVRDKLDATKGLIYLPGQPAWNNEDSDMPAPFRQRRYFYYLSGCNESDCHMTYDIQHDKLALFIPRIDPARVIYNGRGSTPAEALDKYDIDEVYFTDELQAWIRTWSAHYPGRLYVLHDYQTPTMPFFGSDIDSSSLQPAVNLVRMIKDEHEVKLIRKANDISSEAHKQVLANILKFKNEAQVEGLFLNVCISNQAKQQAYDPIAASGPNAGTLHYNANNEDFEDRQLMCLDAGCEYELYASDITRTFPLSGSWPSMESENIYRLVQHMQEACIKKLAPGVRYLDLHILAHHIAIHGLLRLGILHNGTIEEIYKAGTSRAFFPHGLGHHVGLEVHDCGQKELMSLYERNPKYEKAPSLYPEDFHVPVYDEGLCLAPTDPHSPHLEEGMVVTVEPGIYFSSYALSYFYLPSPVHSKYINKDVLYRYFPVGGVRIEDDILITSKGYENLTTAPKGQAMLEIIRSQNAKWPFVPNAADSKGTRTSSVERNTVVEEALLRAPGIPTGTGEPRIKPVSRASTVPVERARKQDCADFERFDGPSLFTGFKRSATIEEPVQHATATHPNRLSFQREQRPAVPLCGNASLDATHLYMVWQLSPRSDSAASASSDLLSIPKCKNCTVLMQSVDRLRRFQWAKAALGLKSESTSLPKIESAATRKSHGMEQVGPVPCRRQARDVDHVPLPHPPHLPVNSEEANKFSFGSHHGLEQEIRNKANANNTIPPTELPKRYSVPVSNYHGKQPDPPAPARPECTLSSRSSKEMVPPTRDARSFPIPTLSQQTVPRPQATASGGIATPHEREGETHFQHRARGPAPRHSLPVVQSDRSGIRSGAAPTSHRYSNRQAPSRLPHQFPDQRSSSNLSLQPDASRPLDISSNVMPHRPSSFHLYQHGNTHISPKTTVAPNLGQPQPIRPQETPLQDQKLEELRKAMDELCKVKEDMERAFGSTLANVESRLNGARQ